MADTELSTSRHFRLEQLADGVYAAIHSEGGEAIGNAGIVDLGDRTLVYDTFFTPQAAADLRFAAETGIPSTNYPCPSRLRTGLSLASLDPTCIS